MSVCGVVPTFTNVKPPCLLLGPQGAPGVQGAQGAQGVPGTSPTPPPTVASPRLLVFNNGSAPVPFNTAQYASRGESSTVFDDVAVPMTRSGTAVRLTINVTQFVPPNPGASLLVALYHGVGFAGAPTGTLLVEFGITSPGIYEAIANVPFAAGDRLAVGAAIVTTVITGLVPLLYCAAVDLVFDTQ